MSDRRPVPVSADALLDRVLRILDREVARFEERDSPLAAFEIDMLVRVANASRAVVEMQLDPLGSRLRKKLQSMSIEDIRERIAELERVEAGQADA